MSGGCFNYIAYSLANALDIPCGDYNEITSFKNNIKYQRVAKKNPMKDIELSMMMYDITSLLKSLEWCESGDIDDDTYLADVKAFKNKWLNRNDDDKLIECQNLIKTFYEDITNSYFGNSKGE